MKNLLALVLSLVLSTIVFGQEKVIEVKSAKDVLSLKEGGKGVVYLPKGLNKEDVQDKAKYYTKYFTVQYNPSTGETVISMEENTDRNRGVIRRFFVANDIRTVQVAGETMDLDTFYDRFLK